MKEYQLVFLNPTHRISRSKDVEEANEMIASYVAQGWELKQIVSPNDVGGAIYGLFEREKSL